MLASEATILRAVLMKTPRIVEVVCLATWRPLGSILVVVLVPVPALTDAVELFDVLEDRDGRLATARRVHQEGHSTDALVRPEIADLDVAIDLELLFDLLALLGERAEGY